MAPNFGICLSTRYVTSLAIGSTAVYLAYRYLTRPKNLPPGPFRLPLIGSIPILATHTLKKLQGFVRKYGDVILCYAGSNVYVFLSSPEVIREAFVKKGHALSGRPGGFLIQLMTSGKGIAMSSGHVWSEHRRFTVSVLREFGVGKLRFEDKIKDATDPLIEFLWQENGKIINPAEIFNVSVANVIGKIVLGCTYERESEDTQRYVRSIVENFKNLDKGSFVDDYPFLQYLPGDLFSIKRTKKNLEFMRGYGRQCVRWHRENPPEEGEPRDFLDAYLQRMSESVEADDGIKETAGFSEEQLLHVVEELFSAGIDTTSGTLLWAFLYMALHQDIQKRVQLELDEMFPSGQTPTLGSRAQCVYTEAVLYEVQRIRVVVPFALPHCATEEVTIGGYLIPKDSVVIPNLWGVMHDPRYWDGPDEFRPERFLDTNGHLAAKQDAFLPFSVGRRACLGDSLARMEMFIFFSTVMQKFSVVAPEGQPPSTSTGGIGLTLPPEPYKVIFVSRDGTSQ